MRTHVCQTVSRCFAALRQLRSIRHLVSATVFQSLVTDLVLSRLDYTVTERWSACRSTLSVAFSLCRMLRHDWYFVSADLTTSRTRSSAYIGYECPKGLCSRSQCRLTGHCTVMPLSTYGSLHQSPTFRPDKDFGLPPRMICAFLPSDCLLLDVVLSLSMALVFGTLFLPTSLQHLLCSLSENV